MPQVCRPEGPAVAAVAWYQREARVRSSGGRRMQNDGLIEDDVDVHPVHRGDVPFARNGPPTQPVELGAAIGEDTRSPLVLAVEGGEPSRRARKTPSVLTEG